MNEKLTLLCALAASLLAPAVARGADTTELKVNGTVRPSACVPSLASGGVIDYGTILAKDVPLGTSKVLGERGIAFTVTCDAPTKIALTAIDNKHASIVPGLIAVLSSTYTYPDNMAFGLGSVAGKNIGAYKINFSNTATADGTSVDIITSVNNTVWATTKISGINHFSYDGKFPKSFATPGSLTPAAFKTFNGSLLINTVLTKGSDLPLTQEIPLDGSATIEIQYL